MRKFDELTEKEKWEAVISSCEVGVQFLYDLEDYMNKSVAEFLQEANFPEVCDRKEKLDEIVVEMTKPIAKLIDKTVKDCGHLIADYKEQAK